MRDIRDDLRERANMLDEQISSAQGQFEKYLEQLRTDQENRLKDLRAELEAVQSLLTIEQRRLGGAPVAAVAPIAPAQPSQPRKSQQPLADYLVRKLAELGPMSKEAIQRLALQEGYFADGDADRGVQAVLMHVVKGGSVRQLPNGDFAEVIRLRRAM